MGTIKTWGIILTVTLCIIILNTLCIIILKWILNPPKYNTYYGLFCDDIDHCVEKEILPPKVFNCDDLTNVCQFVARPYND